MPLCHRNQVWPPLAKQGHQEVAEHCPHCYLWFQCPERPNIWSEPGLIHVELEEDDGTTKVIQSMLNRVYI